MNKKWIAFAMSCVAAWPEVATADPAPPSPSDERLTQPLDRRTALRIATDRNPTVHVAEQRAHAMRVAAKAEGGLPPPELMGQVWQVPLAHPTALDTQMIMVGISQGIPAPGSLSARERSMAALANQEDATAEDRARMVLREAGHAFADYAEASAKHRVHRVHLEVAQHIFNIAQARHAAGGSLVDVARTQVELSRVEADVITDATLAESARAHLNALFGRAPGAALGPPADTEPSIVTWDPLTLIAKAHAARPELKQAQAERESRVYAAEAADREALWPSFTVGALFFPPTRAMPEHSYGANVSMSLPWLWGAASSRREAERERLRAATTNVDAAKFPIDAEVVTAEARARSSAYRLQVLRDRTLPASRRAFEAAQAGFESGRTDLMVVLDTRRSVVDIEHDIIMARADLDHALTDLEAAVGSEIPTRALGPLDPAVLQGGSHAR